MLGIDIGKCTGCKRCEAACAFFHTGRVNNRRARIKVLNLYESGIDGPVVCIQCRERYCLRCPEKALSLGPLGQVVASPTLCTLCGTCEKSCPIGAAELFEGIVHVCDLCGGHPRCVEACTEGALTWIADEDDHPSLAAARKSNRKMSPAWKRYLHLKKQGDEVRKAWRRAHA